VEYEGQLLDGLAFGDAVPLADVGDGERPEVGAGVGHLEFGLGGFPVGGAVEPVLIGFGLVGDHAGMGVDGGRR